MSDGRSSFSYSIPFLYGDSVGGYIKRVFLPVGKYFKENLYYYTCNILFFCFLICCFVHPTHFPVLMLCCWDKFSLYETLFSTQPINLIVEEISQNKPDVQTPIIYIINQKEKQVSIRHNSILTLMKSGAPFFRIDKIYMIYFDVRYFSVVFLSIYYEKLAVKTTLTTMGHFFTKKLNFCPSDTI